MIKDIKQKTFPNVTLVTLLGIVGSTFVHWLVLLFHIPVLDNLPYWKYKQHITPLEPWWVMMAFVAICLVTWLSFSRSNLFIKILGILLLGTLAQYSFAFSTGLGWNGLTARMTGKGHAEFAKVAVRPISMLTMAREYETFISEKYYGFLPSKPPGTLLFYMVTNKVAESIWHSEDKGVRLDNLAMFASLTWPLISCLAVLPLFLVARYLFDDPQLGIVASLLYITVPSWNLMFLVTDQTIYPFLCLLSFLLVILACRYDLLWLGVLSGFVFYSVVYFSFGLAVIGFLFALPVFFNVPGSALRHPGKWIQYGICIVLGIVAAGLLAYFFLNYDIFLRYSGAMAHHIQWRGWDNSLETYLKAGITNIVEFSVWVGFPIVILFLLNVLSLFYGKKQDLSFNFNAIIVLIFLYLLIFGKTKAEAARLWLFLVPFICISVAHYLHKQGWLLGYKKIFVIGILLLEAGTTLFTLLYQNY